MFRSRNPRMQALWFSLLRVRSPLLAQSRLLSSPSGTEMFHFPECRPKRSIEFNRRYNPMKDYGFPHSEISGSRNVDFSPELIAVCHVLHRLMMPRHPSYARIRLARISSLSRYVVILFNSKLSVFKDRKRCFRLVEVVGFEPATFCLQSRHSTN